MNLQAEAEVSWRQFKNPEALPAFSRQPKEVNGGDVRLQQDDNYFYLSNDQTAYVIYKKDGRLAGGWELPSKRRCLVEAVDKYYLDTRAGTKVSDGKSDRCVRVVSLSPLRLQYANKDFSFIVNKEYSLEGDILVQRNVFKGTKNQGLAFLTHSSQVILDRKFRDSGFYCGRGNFVGTLEPAAGITKTCKALNSVGLGSRGFSLLNYDMGLSFTQYRYKIDGRFCFPMGGGKWAGEGLQPKLTADGWQIGLAAHRLGAGKTFSDEIHYKIFRGGQWELWEGFRALPDVKDFYSRHIGSRPAWIDDVKMVSMTGEHTRRAVQVLRTILDYVDDGLIMAFHYPIGDWGDYAPENPSRTGDGNVITTERLQKFTGQMRGFSDRLRLSMYTWIFSTFYYTDVFKKHPEWFATEDRNGRERICYPGHAKNYTVSISSPGCMDHYAKMYKSILERYGYDFFYIDGGTPRTTINWKTGRVDQPYHWQDFFVRWRKIAREYPGNTDRALHLNNIWQPAADVGYLEMPRNLFGKNWRRSANIVYVAKLFQAFDPQRWICPLYWTKQGEPYYTNYMVAMGFRPGHSRIPGDFPKLLPYLNAAYELRNVQLINGQYSPDWRKDTKTQLECFTLRQGEGVFAFLVNHSNTPKSYDVDVATNSVGLNAGDNVFKWAFTMSNWRGLPGRLSESQLRDVYKKTGWGLDRVISAEFLGQEKLGNDWIIASPKLKPNQLNLYMVTKSPALVYSVAGRRSQFWLPTVHKIELDGGIDKENRQITIQCKSPRKSGELLVYVPNDWELANTDIVVNWVKISGQKFAIVPFEKGDRQIRLQCKVVRDSGRFEKLEVVRKAKPGQRLVLKATGNNAPRHGILQASLAGRVVYSCIFDNSRRIEVELPASIRGGKYVFEASTLHSAESTARCIVKCTGGKVPSMQYRKPELRPDSSKIKDVSTQVNGLMVSKIGVDYVEGVSGFEPAFVAGVKVQGESIRTPGYSPKFKTEDFILDAGGSDWQDDVRGFAFSGALIENCPDKLRMDVRNTVYGSVSMRGPDKSVFYYNVGPGFTGILIDYETSQGEFSKRVCYTLGAGRGLPTTSTWPEWGQGKGPEKFFRLLYRFDKPSHEFVVNLRKLAPKNWTGRVWLSVGAFGVMPERRIAVTSIASASGQARESEAPDASELLRDRKISCPFVSEDLRDLEKSGMALTNYAVADTFLLFKSSTPAEQQTKAHLAWNKEGIYARVICDEQEKPRPDTHKSSGIDSPWPDDCVQLKLQNPATGKAYCIIVNADGKMFLGKIVGKGAVATSLDTPPVIKTIPFKDGKWGVEFFMPFNAFDKGPKTGDVWRMNIERNRPAPDGASGESSSWSKWPGWGYLHFSYKNGEK